MLRFPRARARSRIEVVIEGIHTSHFCLSIALVVEVRLLALGVRKHRVTPAIRAWAIKHDALCTKTALHFQVLVFTLDERDDIAAKQHLHFSVAVLKELVFSNLGFVAKEIDLYI